MAFTATQDRADGFSHIFRFGIMPLFLFGGAFFPLSGLPLPVQTVVWATPIAHGVALCRDLVLGRFDAGSAGLHLAVPLLYFRAGTLAASITLTRRLRV
jgi:lipooligosaccharide transport system permease protein